uniref:Uncharacterized protein n=1 Tax=Panagrolaimus sp. JU765 TaxID=591449 RepID=A0AC34QWP5_9BILA
MIFQAFSVAFFCFLLQIAESLKCYSCASENLQENFQTRQRRPPGNLVGIPKVFDNNCDLDFWILRSKAGVDCSTACYKWQQIVNNSGVYSYMTVRACYDSLFGTSPSPIDEASCKSNAKNLDCLPEANLIESSCLCRGSDFCNNSLQIFNFYNFLLLIFAQTFGLCFFG